MANAALQADIVIYGNTSAGVMAAVQAAKMNRSVILVGPDKHLGGLSAGGLGWTDSGAQRIGGWPHQIYVREARRMIGEHVMTEHDCMGTREVYDSVGMGSYTLDSHNVQRYIKPDGKVQNEGDIGVHPGRPYRISYSSLVLRHNLILG